MPYFVMIIRVGWDIGRFGSESVQILNSDRPMIPNFDCSCCRFTWVWFTLNKLKRKLQSAVINKNYNQPVYVRLKITQIPHQQLTVVEVNCSS